MDQDIGSPQGGFTFHPVNSNITAGNDIHLVSNVTVSKYDSSVLTRLKTALNPVASASYDSFEAKRRSECFPNTRVQVLNDIEAWIRGESYQAPIYVLDGVAGIGKSTVAQTIATRAAAVGLLGASFFFSRDEELRKVARGFFPTIAYQLASYDDQAATRISHSLDKNPDAPAKRLYQQLLLLLLEPLQNLLEQKSKPTLVVMDALDECEEEHAEELLSLLGQHIHRMKGLKILITTRPEAHLRDVLDQDKNHECFRLHEIEDSIVHSDIRLYLQCRLSVDEIRKVSRNRQTPWQPNISDMNMLCGICGTLFIIAATATKFILDRKRLNPEKQLARLLEGVSTSAYTGSKHTNVLDKTYLHIILAAHPDLDDNDESWFRDLNNVLGTLITLANPLPCEALASLLDMDSIDVEATLSQLHSLVAPSGSKENVTFRIHHKSFPDFITDRERIQQVLNGWKSSTLPRLDLIWVKTGDQHLQLAKACFRVMDRDLKRNMASINEQDWYKDFDKNKNDIPHVNPPLISPHLAYAALHWASHLLSAQGLDEDLELQAYLNGWLSTHILAWLEVMIILDRISETHDILRKAISSIKHVTDRAWSERTRVEELLLDTYRFVQQGQEVMKISPLQVYGSCLPFIPMETPLYRAYSTMAKLKIGIGRDDQWSPLLMSLICHSDSPGGPVDSVTFSRDDTRLASGPADDTVKLHIFKRWLQLASGSGDNTIRLWDVKTGVHIYTANGHTDGVCSVAFSSDDLHLASGSLDSTVRLWDAKTGAHLFTFTGHSDWVRTIAFSNNGLRLASGSKDNTIRLWDVKTTSHIRTLTRHSDSVQVYSVVFSGDDSRLASGFSDSMVWLWDIETGAHICTLMGHSSSVCSVAFSRDDSWLASGSLDGTIRLWNATTYTHICTLRSSSVYSVAFSSDCCLLASGCGDSRIRLWDLKTGTNVSPPIGHLVFVGFVAFSNDGSRLASSSDDKTVQLWDANTGQSVSTLPGHWQNVPIAFSNDASLLASGSGGQTVEIWSAKTGAHIRTLTGHLARVVSLAFSSDDSRLASGSDDTTVRIWDPTTGSEIWTLTGHSEAVWLLAFSCDGSRLASASEGKMQLWNASTGAHILTLTGPSDLVTSIDFSTDARLVSCLGTEAIRLWDAKTGRHISDLVAPSNLYLLRAAILRNDSQLVNQIFSPDSCLPQSQIQHPIYLLLLVMRDEPIISGLFSACVLSEGEDKLKWKLNLICWFPSDIDVTGLAVNSLNSQVVIGCRNGRVMVLDLSEFSHS